MLEKPMYRGSVSHFQLARLFQTLRARSCQRGGSILRGAGEHPLHKWIHLGNKSHFREFFTKVFTHWMKQWVVCGIVYNRKEGMNYTNTPQKRCSLTSNSGSATYQLCDRDESLVTNSDLGSVKWSLKYACTFLIIIKRKEAKKVGWINKQITICVWIYPYTGILSCHSKAW